MKLTAKIFGIIIILIIGIYLVGFFLPKNVLIKRETLIKKPFFIVWSDINNHFEETSWRSDLDTTIQLKDIDGNPVWKEIYTNGDSVILETTTFVNNVLIARTYVNSPHFEGTRIVNIKKSKKGTFVRVVLEGKVAHAIDRFINLFKKNKDSERLELYLYNLKKKYKNEKKEDNAW